MITYCSLNVVSRSSLNVIDRFLFGKKNFNFSLLYSSSVILPFLYSLLLLIIFGSIYDFIPYFISPSCFLLALATQLVGLCFSYALKTKDVRHVVIIAKLPELIIPCLVLMPIVPEWVIHKNITWQHFIPLCITWVSFLPYILYRMPVSVLFDKSTALVFLSLFFQLLVASSLLNVFSTTYEVLVFTVATLMWRAIFSLYFVISSLRSEAAAYDQPNSYELFLILMRGLISLLAQFTFNWAVVETHPLIVWPIMNTTIIVSSIASQLILKEHVSKSDWVVIGGVFISGLLIKLI